MSPDIASHRWGASIDLAWPANIIVYFLDVVIIDLESLGA
jgi:hypothetical protein